ncbi:helix-turn-helix domain-containing protein [Riemerella columbina]|uniref:helix-turn-helix domain-containing protein n=1 Tax=Riemerella columbina TaxID=103810 RepID=UPI00037B863C|nr:helix-turn-helix domain-containing protein [Riemerella columbina]
MDLLTEKNEQIARYKKQVERLSQYVQFIINNFRPVMNGEIYLTGKEVCEILHITTRTLQQYRDDGFLPYIQIEGKILYKESDILKVLEDNYHK